MMMLVLTMVGLSDPVSATTAPIAASKTDCGGWCPMSTSLVIGLALALVFSVRRLFKRHHKLDRPTQVLLTETDEVPPQCRPCIQALLEPPITSDERECAEQMRGLIQSGCLPYRSLVNQPDLLLSMSLHTGNVQTNGALWTRFTVQYNLFAGSIVALGSDAQREKLFQTQATGDLGTICVCVLLL
jgi:hypothetical protein